LRTQGGQRRYRLRELNQLIAIRQPVFYQQVKDGVTLSNQNHKSRMPAIAQTPTNVVAKFISRLPRRAWRRINSAITTNAGRPITTLGDKAAILLSLGIVGVITVSVWSGVSLAAKRHNKGVIPAQAGIQKDFWIPGQARNDRWGRGNDNGGGNDKGGGGQVLSAADRLGSVGGILSTSDESGNLQLEITVPTKIEGGLQIGGKEVLPASEVVSSLQGKVGALKLVAGTDISIDGLTITDTSKLDTIRGRGGCSACITNADVADDLTLSGGTINNTAIGASTASTGAFTTLAVSSTLAVTGATTLSSTLTVSGASTLSSTLAVTGATTLNGNVTLGDATSDSLTFTGRAASNFIPTTTGTYDLGSSDLKWSRLYLTGVATIGGQSTFTSAPTGTGVGDGVIYINPASSDSSYTLFGIAVNGTEKLRMDADGNITVQGTVIGASGQGIGYWQRSSTTISPATANDIVSYSSNNTTNALAVTATGASTNAINFTADSVTTGNGLSLSVDGLTTGNGISLTSTSTAGGASGASYLLNLARSGTNSNASHTAYGLYSAVTDTGTTSTNIAGYFSASGASTNYGLLVNAGNVGIGTITPSSVLTVSGTMTQSGGATSINDSSNYNTTINTGTSTGAVSIGNSSAGAIALSTSSTFGVTTTTSAQTYTSANVSGTTTSSGFVFTDNATLTGTAAYIGSTGVTTGTLLNVDTGSANTLTTGKLLSLTSAATSLTSGSLLSSSYTGTVGSGWTGGLNIFDYSPSSAPSTAPTGDILRVTLGANATNFAGNLLNLTDNSTSIFSVSKAAVTASIPFNQTSSGDVSLAYDMTFINPTASYITSAAPLYLVAGESFNSSDLTLRTYNLGEIVLDSAVTTGNGVNFNNATLTTGVGVNIASTTLTTGKLVNIAPTFAGAAVTGYGQYINGADSTTSANTDYNLYSTLALSGTAAKIGVGLYSTVTSSSTTGDTLIAADLASSSTGVLGATTRSNYGLRSIPVNSGANNNASSIINMYGGYFNPQSTGPTTGTTSVYGLYAKTLATHASDAGTVNQYGLYVANDATASTNGTSTKYGLYIEALSGADSNYGAYFGSNVGINTTTPGGRLDVAGTTDAFGLKLSQASTAITTAANTLLNVSSATADTSNHLVLIENTSATSNYGNGGADSGIVKITSSSTGTVGTTTTNPNVAGLFVSTADGDTISTLVRNAATTITMADVGTVGAQADPGVLTVEGADTTNVTLYNLIAAYNSTTRSDAASVFRVRADGNVYGEAAFNSTGADYAEYFPTKDTTIGTGEIVSISQPVIPSPSTSLRTGSAEGSNVIPDPVGDPKIDSGSGAGMTGADDKGTISRSSTPYDKKILGVISDNPSVVGNAAGGKHENDPHYKLVGLLGQVNVKVSAENGPIEKGDYLTSSSTPGVAMKATRPGQVIGKALEGFDSSSCVIPAEVEGEVGMTGLCQGKILTFVNPTFADPGDVLATLMLDSTGNVVADFSPRLPENRGMNSANTNVGADGATTNSVIPALPVVIPAEAGIYTDTNGSPTGSWMTTLQLLSSRLDELEKKTSVIASDSGAISASASTSEINFAPSLDAQTESLLIQKGLTVLGASNFNEVGVTGNLTVGLLQISSTLEGERAINCATTKVGADGATTDCSSGLQSAPASTSLRVLGTLKFQDAFGDGVSIDQYGNVKIAGTVTAKKYNVGTTDANSTSLGSGVIPAGATSVTISTTAVTSSSAIFVTPETKTSRTLAVTEKISGKSFKVEITETRTTDLKFKWFIVN